MLIPGAPLGVITTGVQALAGVLLPSATVFLLLLCNDKEVLGPWVNRPWLNVVAGVIVSILLMMSFVLMVTTLFSSINVNVLALVLGGILLVVYVVGRHRPAAQPVAAPTGCRGLEGGSGPTGACRRSTCSAAPSGPAAGSSGCGRCAPT